MDFWCCYWNQTITKLKCSGILSYKIIWPASTDCKSPNLRSHLCGPAYEIFGHGFQMHTFCAFFVHNFFYPLHDLNLYLCSAYAIKGISERAFYFLLPFFLFF